MLDDIDHGSNVPIDEIRSGDSFGGNVASASRESAESHDEYVYEVFSQRYLNDLALNHDTELDAFRIAVEVAGDEETAEAIMPRARRADLRLVRTKPSP